MEIQRVKFLLIASALAAPACVTTVTEDNPGSGTGGSSGSSTGGAQNGTGGRVGTGGKSTGGASTGGASTGGTRTDGSVGGSDAGTGGAGGSAGADGSAGGSQGDGAISDGSVSIDANRPDGNVCDDDTITGGYGDCALMAGDACNLASFQVGQCNDAKTTMKPFIAQQAILCMLDNAAACDPIKTYGCKDAAVHIACPDSTSDDECATIHTACSAVSVDDCKLYLNGLTQAGRDGMVTCLTGNCSFGLYTCIEGL